MNRTELLELLDGTEWVDFELKSAQGGVPVDAFKTLSAFANSGGGWLVFGVGEGADGYEIHGIGDVDRFQNELLSTCRSSNKLRRPVSIHPRLFRFDEGWVLALRVDEAPRFDKPVRVRIKGRWRAYVRVGGFSETRNPLIARMLRQAGLAEQAGSGLPRIRRTWDETGRPKPLLRNDGGRKRFEMIFPWGEERDGGVNGAVERVKRPNERVDGAVERVKRPNERVNGAVERVKRPGERVNEPPGATAEATMAERVLLFVRAEPGARVPEMVAHLGISQSSVRRALRVLKADGRVTFRGAPKTGGYQALPSDDREADS